MVVNIIESYFSNVVDRMVIFWNVAEAFVKGENLKGSQVLLINLTPENHVHPNLFSSLIKR